MPIDTVSRSVFGCIHSPPCVYSSDAIDSYAGSGSFPVRRMRRNRSCGAVRTLLQETTLTPRQLILPIFIQHQPTQEISTLPGVMRWALSDIDPIIKQATKAGIQAVMLFPVIPLDERNAEGSFACDPDGLVCQAVRHIKNIAPQLMVICDVALDPYTDHGHDGIMIDTRIDNDATLHVLAKQAICLASAGCDTVAPSDMMDGRVGFIRKALDDYGFVDVRILSYAVKYASSLYGPFRDALGSGGHLVGDKKTYQMDIHNQKEAVLECQLDISEGADMILLKPGITAIDVVAQVAHVACVPVFCYQVSGEYAMIMGAQSFGMDPFAVLYEHLIAMRRAGARCIVTYGAIEVTHYLK